MNCDTMVALGTATKDGSVLFGKNSDREPDEIQNLVVFPRQAHQANSRVKCTYIDIPQVSETAAILLCQPFWMFGGEMGVNEYGVAIGNEALFTKEKPDETGLLGMDLLRLALERSKTAKEARDCLVHLLEEYGQGGNCVYRGHFVYMNSFLIADEKEAFVLETVKRWWAWKAVQDIWSISNIISQEKDYDSLSSGLVQNAIKHGWCDSEGDFNFRKCYTDKIISWGAGGKFRQSCSRRLLGQKKEALTSLDIMTILRDHGNDPKFHPQKGFIGSTVCMHAANSLIRRSQSVGSLVAHLGKPMSKYYVTGASSPCLRPFFPVFFPKFGLPTKYIPGDARFNPKAYWWLAERYHRKALDCFPKALTSIEQKISSFEKDMVSNIESNLITLSQEKMDDYFNLALSIVENHGMQLENCIPNKLNPIYRRYWHFFNKKNQI
jgi:secernin